MSFILSQILKKKVLDWNEKIFTEDDFYRVCKIEKVRVFEDETLKYKGEYTIYENVPFIALRKNLQNELLWVGFHELGHHLIHYPVAHKFSKGIWRRMDREANFFAAIALMPSGLIKAKTFGEIIEEYNYPKELIRIRKDIYDTYKI